MMKNMRGKQSLEEDLSDLRMEGISSLREMKIALNGENKDEFDACFGKYKSAEREYHSKCREMFPDRIDNKYESIMIASYDVFN